MTSGSSLGDYDSSFLFDYLNVPLVFGGGKDGKEYIKLSSGNAVSTCLRVMCSSPEHMKSLWLKKRHA